MKVLTFKNDTVSVGDIFVSSWGYEQTNVTFYQVLSVHGKKTVTVREIRANSEYTDSMVGFKTPVLNDFRGLTLSGTKTHVKQRFLPLTPLLMVSDDLWSPVLPA